MSAWHRLFYNFLYLGKPPWDTGVSPPELMAFIKTHPPGRALDLGCGTGTNAVTLAVHGWQVTGVDFVGSAIRLARRKARQAGQSVDFRQGNVARLAGVPGPFDLILDIGCFHGLSEQEKAAYVDNLERLLAPDGAFLIYAFFSTPSNTWSGLKPTDLDLLSQRLRLAQRQDGLERGSLPSAWFTYRLK